MLMSKTGQAEVLIQGVPAVGILDSGADITIIGAEKIAVTDKVKKKHFKKPDRVPKTYDGHTFSLHGRIDLDISFGDKTMTTPIYVKMRC